MIFVFASATADNEGFLGRAELERIRPGSVFLLMSRAGVVDFDALRRARGAGRFTAATDVWPEEPVPAGQPARTVDGMLLSPHRAGGMREAFLEIGRLAVADLELILRGLPPCAASGPSARRPAACAAGRSRLADARGLALLGGRRRGSRGTAPISFSAWRSGAIRTTFQASPTLSIVRITSADRSSSQRLRPCSAERGKAWWLWCHASPIDGRAIHHTLVDLSSISNRREPE